YPIFGVSSLPFLADSLHKAEALTEASRPAYEKILAEHGQKLLYTTPWPASGIWSKQPIKTVADLRSLTVRTYDGTSQRVMEKAGAKAMNLSFSEVMPRIASGEVNAVLSSGDGGAGRKLWNYLPCFAEINYAMPISIATMNLDAYNALDAADRNAIDQAAALTEDAQWARIQGRLKENYANMRKNGVKIDMRVPSSVKKALKAASSDSLDAWKAATGADGDALLIRYEKR
ncbi:MAG: TRAP transporter substrate-binding protein, partial [Bordetella sp.]|uniref:TRAP transporter substrate-binding protein n=1 Tax=Bordetella sp. TaxID=28081 RepID=UPI003F7B3B11